MGDFENKRQPFLNISNLHFGKRICKNTYNIAALIN
jgi:hypothetical protein